MDANYLHQVVPDYYPALPRTRESHHQLDGMTRRGTLPAGRSRAIDLPVAYLTGEQEAQVLEGEKKHRVFAAAHLWRLLGLRGKIVSRPPPLA